MASKIYDLARQFFGFGEGPKNIKIILPSVSQKREVSLRCENYPLFDYEISPDDMYSALRIHSLLTSIYGDIVEVYSHNDIRTRPSHNNIFIGGPPTNSFSFQAVKNAPIRFGGDNVNRVFQGKERDYKIGFSSADQESRWITEDYSLISKRKKGKNIEFIIAGLRAYGQVATYEFLNEEDFYLSVQDISRFDSFQILVQIIVDRKTCSGWKVIEKTMWDPDISDSCIIQDKKKRGQYDVFFSYNSNDKKIVKEIAEKLKNMGILPWLDQNELRPGMDWQEILEKQIKNVKCAAVFIGKSGKGPWQNVEIKALIQEMINRQSLVIPVILPDCEGEPEIPYFLKSKVKVDFRIKYPDPIGQLRLGILATPDI